MLVRLRHTEPANGVSLEVELDQYGGFVSHNPAIVPRLDRDDLWSYELQSAAVCILNVDLAAGQETDVRVHAQIGSGDGLHVGGPTKPGRVDHTLHAACAGSDDVELDTADVAVFAFAHGCDEWITHEILL
jgi:hypothetical protein